MRKEAISGPVVDLLQELRQHDEMRVKKLLDAGLLTRLLKANVKEVNLDSFEQILGLKGPPSPLRITRNFFGTIDGARQVLKKAGISVGIWGNEMLAEASKVEKSDRLAMEEVCMVFISNEALGYPCQFTHREIFVSAAKRGLQKCIIDDAIAARIQYRLQPYDMHIRIAMDAVPDKNGSKSIFRLDCTDENGLSIDGIWGDLDKVWSNREGEPTYWAFIQPEG